MARMSGRQAVRKNARTDRYPASSASRPPAPGTARADSSASLSQPPREPWRPPAWTVRAACGGCAVGSRSRDRRRRRAGVRCRPGPAPGRLANPCHANSGEARSPAGPRRRPRPASPRGRRGVAGRRAARGPAARRRRNGPGVRSGPGRPHRGSGASRSRRPTNRTGRCRRRGTGRARNGRVMAASAQPAEDRWDAPSRTRSRRCEPESAGRSRWRGGRDPESCVQCRRCQPRAIYDLADPAAYPMSY
jgi:hypothetical protein